MKIIALSGYGQQEHRIESKQARCDAHLVKPVDPDVLRRILAEGDGADHPTDGREGPLTTERQ